MKRRAIAGRASVPQPRYMTALTHRRAGLSTALIVRAVPALPTRPGVGAGHHPAFRQRWDAWCACRTPLHCEAPASTRLGPPGVQGLVVIRLIGHDRHEPRHVVGRDQAEPGRGRPPSLETSTGHADGSQPPQRLAPEMTRAPLAFLAALRPAPGAFPLEGLNRSVSRPAARGGTPHGHAGPLAPGRDHLVPGPVVAPLGTVVRHGALGQPIGWSHIPWTAASLPVKHGMEDVSPIPLPRAPSSWARLGRGEKRFYDGPGLVRHIRGSCLARTGVLNQNRALRC